MKKYTLDVFEMAELQLQKEVTNRKRKSYKMVDVLDYAVIIGKYIDRAEGNKKVADIRWGNKEVKC